MSVDIRAPLDSASSGRILVVDDHRDSADVFAKVLRLYEYDAVSAYSSAEATELCRVQVFDLLITDVELRDGDGRELFRRLHAAYRMRGIAWSGHAHPSDIAEGLLSGFDAYLTKPTTIETLLAAVDMALGAKARSSGAPARLILAVV
jgi:two-component system CheB/CheR fusion protein